MAELEELKAEPDEPTSLLNRVANVRLAGTRHVDAPALATSVSLSAFGAP
jgi:hypothetical protein